jgi:hypothetical protein
VVVMSVLAVVVIAILFDARGKTANCLFRK